MKKKTVDNFISSEKAVFLSLPLVLQVVPGELTIVTGVPNSGKSEWLDALCCNLAEMHGWTFAMCSMEKKVGVLFSLFSSLRRIFWGVLWDILVQPGGHARPTFSVWSKETKAGVSGGRRAEIIIVNHRIQ